jgi:class 3 adenylate cyclase
MTDRTTVVFADLAGSTGVFEALGNARATEAITGLTQWIASLCERHKGRVVKMLGDGVLAVFPDARTALAGVVALQRGHARQVEQWPGPLRMRLQIGVAAGEVIEVDGDCYGDAVIVASRLSDLAGPEQIWATASVVAQLRRPMAGVGMRSLGPIRLRGMSKDTEVFRIDWQEDSASNYLTQAGALTDRPAPGPMVSGGIRLAWLDQWRSFSARQMPIHLGRADEAQFPVQHQRVSRIHARVDWRDGNFMLTDMSSYGTWVRFSGGASELALRRSECVLVGTGEITLGAPFEDLTAPRVTFEVLPGA